MDCDCPKPEITVDPTHPTVFLQPIGGVPELVAYMRAAGVTINDDASIEADNQPHGWTQDSSNPRLWRYDWPRCFLRLFTVQQQMIDADCVAQPGAITPGVCRECPLRA